MHSVGETVLHFCAVSFGYGAYEWQAKSGAVAVALVVEAFEDARGIERLFAAVCHCEDVAVDGYFYTSSVAVVHETVFQQVAYEGGGDSVACINKFGMAEQVSYITTGGGALLEAIEGKVLPGVAAFKGE